MQAWPQTTRVRGDPGATRPSDRMSTGQQHVGVGVVGTVNAGAGGGADDVDQQQGRGSRSRAATGRLRRAACASHGAGRSRNRRARRGPARSRGTAGRPRCRARRRETRSGRPPAHRGRSTRGRGSADELATKSIITRPLARRRLRAVQMRHNRRTKGGGIPSTTGGTLRPLRAPARYSSPAVHWFHPRSLRCDGGSLHERPHGQ